jgi:hypothetical protein
VFTDAGRHPRLLVSAFEVRTCTAFKAT